MTSSQIIDALGGTAEVARLCDVKMPSVSQWRNSRIPPARLMFLKLARPDVFANDASEAAPSQPALKSATPHNRRHDDPKGAKE